MKNLKIIPLLSLTVLLSSCGTASGKAPSFAKEGDEVKYSKFQEDVYKAYKDSELYDDDTIYGDRLCKMAYYESSVETQKRGKKEISKSESATSATGEAQYDGDNYVAKTTTEMKGTYKSTVPEGEATQNANQKSEIYYQFGKVDSRQYLLSVNNKKKTYYGYTSVVDSKKDVFNSFIGEEIMSLASPFENYLPDSEADAKEYTFYIKDETLFTYSAAIEKEENAETTQYNYSTGTSTSVKYGVKKTKLKVKVQLNLEDKNQSLKVSYEKSVQTTYTKDYNGYAEDDVVITESKSYIDYSAVAKKVDVKELDLSDYTYTSSSY